MLIQSIEIEKFRSFHNVSFALGKRITAIAGRNATQKTTVLGMIGQPFTINKNHPMHGCKTIDGYNFRSQFSEKFKISTTHDIIGEHRWKLNFHRNIHTQNYFQVESIPRIQRGRPTTLRFWNAESRNSGAGYVQLPVYYLSLSRLFPIGEIGKTHTMPTELTPEELNYCITHYCEILSIHGDFTSASVGMEKGSSTRTFTGVSDRVHDIFTNSAGESNITRIILAVLSFKRLQEQYPNDYKGGILLIDEIDATLYGYSQEKLVQYLYKASEDFHIQIVFTTHSPIILKAVNRLLRQEVRTLGINCPPYAYNSAIVYLEPNYDEEGVRTVSPRNVVNSSDLTVVLNDINLTVPTTNSKINVYCEDDRASSMVRYLLTSKLGLNIDLYMNFVSINLGWTNYIQLYTKRVPEFTDNVIILDGDVPQKPGYESKRDTIDTSDNILLLPLVIEKDLFDTLKDHAAFNVFSSNYSQTSAFNYDICFRDWTQSSSHYDTLCIKQWYSAIIQAIGNEEILFRFWCDRNTGKCTEFTQKFVAAFNKMADKKDADALPCINPTI